MAAMGEKELLVAGCQLLVNAAAIAPCLHWQLATGN
jgi:hypothetical protein